MRTPFARCPRVVATSTGAVIVGRVPFAVVQRDRDRRSLMRSRRKRRDVGGRSSIVGEQRVSRAVYSVALRRSLTGRLIPRQPIRQVPCIASRPFGRASRVSVARSRARLRIRRPATMSDFLIEPIRVFQLRRSGSRGVVSKEESPDDAAQQNRQRQSHFLVPVHDLSLLQRCQPTKCNLLKNLRYARTLTVGNVSATHEFQARPVGWSGLERFARAASIFPEADARGI